MVGLALWLLTARVAHAQGPNNPIESIEPIEPIAFEWSAPTGCPSEEQISSQIRAYTSNWTITPEQDGVRLFRLRAERRDDGYRGRFDLRDKKGTTVSREVTGESCEDVALALAITVALALDPRANLAGDQPSKSTRGEETEAPVTDRDLPREPPRESTVIRARGGESAAPRARLAVGTRLEGTTAVSGVLAVVDAFVEIEVERTLERLPWFRPVLRLGFRQSFTRTASVGEARVDIDWTAAQIEICPSRTSLAPSLSADVCAGSNVGELTAMARDIPGARPARRFWFDYGGLLALRWQAHPNLFAEITGAAWVPRTRDRLRVAPDGIASRAPAAGISMGVGIGWRF